MANETQQPIHTIRNGAIQASIWEQTSEKGHPFLTVTFSRSYKDKTEQWKTGHSYQAHELDALIDAAIDAKDWMRQHRRSTANAA